MPTFRPARLAVASILTLGLASPLLGGCSTIGGMFSGGDSTPDTTAAAPRPAPAASASTLPPAADPVTTATAPAVAPAGTETAVASTEPPASATPVNSDQIDVRRYLGPNYCPELRILDGAELMRQYEKGHEDDAKSIVWQASIGKIARECLYDLQGGLTLKVGISGRVIAGPKGGAATVTVPLKIAVVKYQESVVTTQDYKVDAAIPANGATTFTQVNQIVVPSPGKERDYIIYVGFAAGKWDAMHGKLEPVVVAVPRKPPPPPVDFAPAPPKPQKPKQPNVLPVPDSGFVLPR